MTSTAVIDLNSVAADGTTRVRLTNLSGSVSVGETVIVHEPEEDISGAGVVERVDGAYAHIRIDRASLGAVASAA